MASKTHTFTSSGEGRLIARGKTLSYTGKYFTGLKGLKGAITHSSAYITYINGGATVSVTVTNINRDTGKADISVYCDAVHGGVPRVDQIYLEITVDCNQEVYFADEDIYEKKNVNKLAVAVDISGITEKEQEKLASKLVFKMSDFNFKSYTDDDITEPYFLNNSGNFYSLLSAAINIEKTGFNYFFGEGRNRAPLPFAFMPSAPGAVINIPKRNLEREADKDNPKKLLPFKSLKLWDPPAATDYHDLTLKIVDPNYIDGQCKTDGDIPIIFITYKDNKIKFAKTTINNVTWYVKLKADDRMTTDKEILSAAKFYYDDDKITNALNSISSWQELEKYDKNSFVYIALQGGGAGGGKGYAGHGGLAGASHGNSGSGGGAFLLGMIHPAANIGSTFFMIPGQNGRAQMTAGGINAYDNGQGSQAAPSIIGMITNEKCTTLATAMGGFGGSNDVGYQTYPGQGGFAIVHDKSKFIPLCTLDGKAGGKCVSASGFEGPFPNGNKRGATGECYTASDKITWTNLYTDNMNAGVDASMANNDTLIIGRGGYGGCDENDSNYSYLKSNTYSGGGGGGASVCSACAYQRVESVVGWGYGGKGSDANIHGSTHGQSGGVGFVSILDIYSD